MDVARLRTVNEVLRFESGDALLVQVAERLRLPVIYLVDCSGLFLPEQSRSFSGRTGAGHIFTRNARLAGRKSTARSGLSP